MSVVHFPGPAIHDDPILLMLDNTQRTLEDCIAIAAIVTDKLDIVLSDGQRVLTKNLSDAKRANLLKNYIVKLAPAIMRSVGDSEQASVLLQSYLDMKAYYRLTCPANQAEAVAAYWMLVLHHYRQKWSEQTDTH